MKRINRFTICITICFSIVTIILGYSLGTIRTQLDIKSYRVFYLCSAAVLYCCEMFLLIHFFKISLFIVKALS